MNPKLLDKVEVLVMAGRYDDALRVLESDPQLYSYVVNQMVNALLSYPGGKIADLNGRWWSTAELAQELQRGHWLPVHFNFLLSEISLIKRQLGGNL